MYELVTRSLRAHERALGSIATLRDVPALLMRLTLAGVFISSGYGKLGDLEKVAVFFTDLGIPLPYFNAVLVSITELVGGSLVLIGLGTRLACLPLLNTMVVAILTAQLSEVDGVSDFLGLSEVAYGVMFLTLVLLGPGRLSLDHLLHSWLSHEPTEANSSSRATAQLSL